MSERRASGGAPLLTLGQWLVVAAVVGATWLVWWEVRVPRADPVANRSEDAQASPIEAGLENLRELEAIARTGPDGVPDLVAALADPVPRHRRNALLALKQMGPEASEALPHVRERLADADGLTRSFAVFAFWHIRRDADEVAAVVAPMLGDPDANVREAAAKVLHHLGPPAFGPVLELLQTGVPGARVPALRVLRRIGWDDSQPRIENIVRDVARDADARLEALRTIASWGRPALSEIEELLQHKEAADNIWRNVVTEPGPRETALVAVMRMGPEAAESLNVVVDLLAEDRDAALTWNLVLAALRSMRTAARPAVPRLLEFVNDKHCSPRIDIGWTLLAIGGDPQEIVDITMPLLGHEDPDTCFQAGRLCASTGLDEARRQVSRLIPQLHPEKIADRIPALNAVWGLAPQAQEAIPALCRLLECGQPPVARIAAKTLGDIGPEAAPAIPALLAQLARGPTTHDYWARSAFCEALGKMGPAARSAIPALLAELNDAPLSRTPRHDSYRTGQRPVGEALSAVVRIGTADPEVLEAIRRHFLNEDEWVQIAAIRGLARLTPDSPEVLTRHLNWLRDNRGVKGLGVILAIGRLPGDRREAVSPLTALLTDSAPEVRKAAAWSLAQIGPGASPALPFLRGLQNDWENSLYSFHERHFPRLPSLASDPRRRLEMGRWHDLDDPLIDGMAYYPFRIENSPFQQKSVQQVMRETIVEIEGGSGESGPSGDRFTPASLPSP